MFGRTVSINGTEVFVTCSPSTPYSEICLRAAKLFKTEEEHETKMRALALMQARELEQKSAQREDEYEEHLAKYRKAPRAMP